MTKYFAKMTIIASAEMVNKSKKKLLSLAKTCQWYSDDHRKELPSSRQNNSPCVAEATCLFGRGYEYSWDNMPQPWMAFNLKL